MEVIRIAVLLTTFNRKAKTVACLNSLKAQQTDPSILLKVYVTDDFSADGTPDAIKEIYPDANIYIGTGKLFWAGGMRVTWTGALKEKHDFYLLLNDDTLLLPNTIQSLVDYYKKDPLFKTILVGTTRDSGGISYGGRVLNSKLFFRKMLVSSETDYLDCDLGNANIMLVPENIVEKIGILSDSYTHGIADFDYTLTAKKAGFKVLVAPGILGICSDDHGNNWKSANTTLKERINYLKSPKGLAYKEYLFFIRKHLPIHYPIAYVMLWAKTLVPKMWDLFKK